MKQPIETVFILARLGIVDAEMLKRKRKFAILINTILAAVISPSPDVLSMMLMLVPLLLFYELGILVAWVFGKKRQEVVVPVS